jgi:hypothetical protein
MPVGSHSLRRALTIVALALVAATGAGCGGSDDRPDRRAAQGPPGTLLRKQLPGRITKAEGAAKAAPTNPKVLRDLTRLYIQYAYQVGNPQANTLGPEGIAQLRKASATWERYLALKPNPPSVQLATSMARNYGQSGLDEPLKAIRAMKIAADYQDPPLGPVYAQLALLYYAQHDYRPGDRASRRAVELTPLPQRADLRRQLREIRSQAKTQD